MLYTRAISLMEMSPFQQSLSSEFHDAIDSLNTTKAVDLATDDEFSDACRFVDSRNPLRVFYESEVTDRALRNDDLMSDGLYTKLTGDERGAYLHLKLISEYALAQSSKDSKLQTFQEITFLQRQTDRLREMSDEIQSQLKTNSQLLNMKLDTDPERRAQVLEQQQSLTENLVKVEAEIRENLLTLMRQYATALSLSNFDDLALPKSSEAVGDERADELMSYIASLAVQRNVVLPPPGDSKLTWAKSCLDQLLESSLNGESRSVSKEEPMEISNVKTALQDLQFAHQYLTKQYEEERSLNAGIAESYNKKQLILENKLSQANINLEKATQKYILVEHEKSILQNKFDEKSKEINELRRQLALLKLDHIGKSNESLGNGSPQSLDNPRTSGSSASSPITGLSISVESDDTTVTNPKTPLLQQQVKNGQFLQPSSYFSTCSPPKFSGSISVLRDEFKKVVVDLQNDYEAELEKERVERRRLEDLLRLHEERDSESIV
ncbi:Pea2p CYBJADRAFT_169095 [Cyberlindnera jadinii NRRL Y-1542]|uniref:Uncharacterized protein n=2 Tax=Cyberlindnera jadinii (strain ATCC 18201 / CBS 1600 / BCRC 20928 / JCM 3617 / NBRC 0987 / NRRL Y-1542) TaxID=983966 RepID=A0A1E4RWS6_CYBJN|nr:hypothetical protein CYBJADRAFT_169095 [Cyberlindnera jadinii NRRL Y-1542]ODV71729.1 hypothetical protein CYBJADRAFT_169095 [Cyberlindnera jadinii NRRL Y-1542]